MSDSPITKKSLKLYQTKADEWNAAHPAGASFLLNGATVKTTGPAVLIGGYELMVPVEGRRDRVPVSKLTPNP